MEGEFEVNRYKFRGHSKLFLQCVGDSAPKPLDLTLKNSTNIFTYSGEPLSFKDLKDNERFLANSKVSAIEGEVYGERSDDFARIRVSAIKIKFSLQSEELPTILFDLNYHDQMTEAESRSLSHQLQLSYTTNRNSPKPFNFILGGNLVSDSHLLNALDRKNFSEWERCIVSSENPEKPWSGLDLSKVVYLCSQSPIALSGIDDGFTYVLGGLVDHTDKPNIAADRAKACGIQTARIPLEKFMKMTGRNGSTDITTLAVVQCLVNIRLHNNDWEQAITSTKAFFSAPLRKYVQWCQPYDHLNDEETHRSRRPGANFSIT